MVGQAALSTSHAGAHHAYAGQTPINAASLPSLPEQAERPQNRFPGGGEQVDETE